MKTKRIILLFTLCLLLSLMVLPVSAASLKVGVAVEKTLYKTITTESPLELGRIDQPDPANGLTISAEKTGDNIFSIYYEGTPSQAGVSYFAVSYVVDDTPIGEYGTLTVEKAAEDSPEMPTTPLISSSSPASDINCLTTDNNVFFSVSASANGSLSYRWLLDGTDLNVSGNTMTLTPSSLTEGNYRIYCEITNSLNGYQQATDTSWSLTVSEPVEKPTISSTASAAEISGSGSAKFSVQAEGKNLTYQWYEEGSSSPLSDGTTGAISLNGTATSSLKVYCSGSPETLTKKYYCRVSDSVGNSVNSGTYSLYIKEDSTLSIIKEISVASLPSKLEYEVGDTLDLTGMTLQTISGKGTETITGGFACEPMLLQEEGTQTIRVSYAGKTTSFEVSVNNKEHDHVWTDWALDKEHNMVSRSCAVSGCTVKEIFSELAFIQEYPEEARRLNIQAETEQSTNTAAPDDTIDDNQTNDSISSDVESSKTAAKTSVSVSQVIFWIIFCAAAVLLTAAIVLYFHLYGNKTSKRNQNKTNTK